MNKNTKIPETLYNHREFLTDKNSEFTNTVVAFYGTRFDYNGDLEKGGFFELTDCKGKVRLHTFPLYPDSDKVYLEMIRKLEKVIKEYGDFLESIAPD